MSTSYDDDEPTGPNPRLVKVGIVVAVLAIAGGLVWFFTCEKRTRSSDHSGTNSIEEESKIRDELFDNAWGILNHLEQFDGGEMFREAIDRLDQWVRSQKAPPDWQVDPMAAELLAGLGGLADQIQPINDLVSRPRRLLEFKRLVRQFEDKPGEVKTLIRTAEPQGHERLRPPAREDGQGHHGRDAPAFADGAGRDDFRKKVLEQFERRVQDQQQVGPLPRALAM